MTPLVGALNQIKNTLADVFDSCERGGVRITPPVGALNQTKNTLADVFDSCERGGARTLNQRLKRPLLYH